MKLIKLLSMGAAASIAALSLSVISLAATTKEIDMQETGYGINGSVVFTDSEIVANVSTLGDLAEKYDFIEFSISADDLGGRDDLLFQVYVAADTWGVWANGESTPPITEAGVTYGFSLDVDAVAEKYGADKVICDMGFQILSQTPGAVTVNYEYEFTSGEPARSITSYVAPDAAQVTDAAQTTDTATTDAKANNPDTGIADTGVLVGVMMVSALAVTLTKKRAK